jgi:hypothetical protein
MSDMFAFRDSLEPEGATGLTQQPGAGAGATEALDVADFDVEATDGSVGRVMDASYGAGESYLVVDTGGTILSKRVVLPAGVVERVDRDSRKVYVDRSKDEITGAPEFDEEQYRTAAYREQLSRYYGR